MTVEVDLASNRTAFKAVAAFGFFLLKSSMDFRTGCWDLDSA